jgi:O-antigen ligase
MLGYVCLVAAIVICGIAIFKPIFGTVGFYFFALLDPIWNWRWVLSKDLGFQKWLFFATLIGVLIHWGTLGKTSKLGHRCILLLIAFWCIAFTSGQLTSFPEASVWYNDILSRVFAMAGLGILTVTNPRHAFWLGLACVLGQGYNTLEINREYFQMGFCRYAYMANWGYKGLDNNGYSILTVPVLAIALSIALCPGNLKLRAVAGLIGVLEMHQLMMMESRGSMIGAVLFGALAVFFIPKTKQSIALILAGVVVAGVLAGPPVVKEFMSSFAEGEELDSSAESRFYLWKAGMRIMLDHPWIGVGPNASRFYVPSYYEGGLDTSAKALHNLFFEVGCENGIPAVCIFFTFYGLPWLYVFQNRHHFLKTNQKWTPSLCIAVLAGTPGYLMASMFSSGALIESSYILPIIACGLASSKEFLEQNDESQTSEEFDEPWDESFDSSEEMAPEPVSAV